MELSRKDCNALRGLAIICIFIHNYCHILPNAPAENEFVWSIDNTYYFWSSLQNSVFISFFSFLGHYGVAVFVFASGYGLVKKYDGVKLFWRKYLLEHYKKLLKLMLPGLVTYLTVYYLLYGWLNGMNIIAFLAQLFFVNNFIPTIYSPIVPGVYWYFGLSLQLYVLYLLLRSDDYSFLLFALVCALIMFLSVGNLSLISWLKCNCVGYALPFAIGVYLAKYGNRCNLRYDRWKILLLCLLSFTFVLVSEFSYYSWLFASVPVLCFAVSIIKLLYNRLRLALIAVGTMSHLIFIIHPTTRTIMRFVEGKYNLGWQTCICIYIVLTLIICCFIYYRRFKIWERI